MAKVMISIPDALLKQIDEIARSEHRKRSEFFKELALRYLSRFRVRGSDRFSDLRQASMTSTDFWDNPTDDEIWNEP